MALLTVLMCVNFVSCSNEEVLPDEPTQDKYITVGLDCVGEYLDITDSPLSRAVGNDAYYIQVYSVDDEDSTTPYAYGNFETSLNGVTIKLLQGKKYNFKVAISIGGSYEYGYYDTKFTYSSKEGDNWLNYESRRIPISIEHEGYYGELDEFIPEEGANVEIETKRVSYAANFIAENLDEGTLDIKVIGFTGHTNGRLYSVNLTPEVTASDKIYSFYDAYYTWEGIYEKIGTDPETGKGIYEYKDYSCVYTLDINWTKADGDVIPLGTYNVRFKRNVRTTIRINVENLPTVSNGIIVTKEETSITDDENEYEISGGEIVEVPVNSES